MCKKKPQKTEPEKSQPNICDWIQTFILVLTFAFLVNEFVVKDRQSQSQRVAAAQAIVVKTLELDHYAIWQALDKGKEAFAGRVELSRQEWGDVWATLEPANGLYRYWGFCYAHNLCDQRVTLNTVCYGLTKYIEHVSNMMKQSIHDKFHDFPPMTSEVINLNNECRDWSKTQQLVKT